MNILGYELIMHNYFKKKILKILSWIVFISLLTQIINGLWPQISMFLFKGYVIIPNIFFKSLIIFSIFANILLKLKKEKIYVHFYKIYLIFIIYLFFEFFYFLINYNYDWKVIFWGFNVLYFYLFLVPFCLIFKNTINQEKIWKILVSLFFIAGIVGILQNYLNSPILLVKSIDEYFQVKVYGFYSHIRAFSFFSTSLNFAIFSTFMGLLFIQKYEKKKYLYSLFFFLTYYCVYITYSRTGYLIFIFSLVNYWIIYIKLVNLKIIKYLPLLNMFIGIFLIIIITFWGVNINKNYLYKFENENYNTSTLYRRELGKKDLSKFYMNFQFLNKKQLNNTPSLTNILNKDFVPLYSKDTLNMRIILWKIYYKLIKSNWMYLFFGTGLFRTGRTYGLDQIVIDNMYLYIILHIGIVGLFIVLTFLIKIWKFIISLNSNSIYVKSIISIFPTLFLSGFLGDMLPYYLSYLCLVFVIRDNY